MKTTYLSIITFAYVLMLGTACTSTVNDVPPEPCGTMECIRAEQRQMRIKQCEDYWFNYQNSLPGHATVRPQGWPIPIYCRKITDGRIS